MLNCSNILKYCRGNTLVKFSILSSSNTTPSGNFFTNFGSDTPFMLLAKLKVKEDKVAEYLEIAGGCCIRWRENREFNQCISSAIFKYVWAI